MALTSRCSVNAYACSDFNFCSIVCIKKELSLKLFSKASICISGLTDVTRKLFVYLLKKKKKGPHVFVDLNSKMGLFCFFFLLFYVEWGEGEKKKRGGKRRQKEEKSILQGSGYQGFFILYGSLAV